MYKYFYDPNAQRRREAIDECLKSGELDYLDALQYLLALAERRPLTAREEAVRRTLDAYLEKWASPTLN